MEPQAGDIQPKAVQKEKSLAPSNDVKQPSIHQKASMSEQQTREGHNMSLGSILQDLEVPKSHGSKRAVDEEGESLMTKR